MSLADSHHQHITDRCRDRLDVTGRLCLVPVGCENPCLSAPHLHRTTPPHLIDQPSAKSSVDELPVSRSQAALETAYRTLCSQSWG